MDEEPVEVVRRSRGKRLVLPSVLLVLVGVLALLWASRMRIAQDYLDRELARRGVQASYDVERIEFGRQQLANLVIGDPRNPDLVARSVELRLSWGFRRPRIALVTARGVRLRGRVIDGRVSFGQIDKLLPPPSGAPFRFPDQAVDVADASLRLDTPWGRIGLGLEGKGNLADGFRGKLAAASQGVRIGTCRLAAPRAFWQIAIDDARPHFAGPLRATSIGCGDLRIDNPNLALDATLTEALDGWRGKAGMTADAATRGADALGAFSGKIGFEGNAATTSGGIALAARSLRSAKVSAGRSRLDGRYSVSLDSGAMSLKASVGARGVSAAAIADDAARQLAAAGGTPAEAIGEALAAAVRNAGRSFDATAMVRLTGGASGGGIRIDRLAAVSRSGARLTLHGGQGITYVWPTNLSRVDGMLALAGGGFPTTSLSLRQQELGGPISGEGRIAPMIANGARLALAPVRFQAGRDGMTRLETVATMDGRFSGGSVSGLVVPIAARLDGHGGFAINEGCTTVRFRALATGTLRLAPATLPLCATGRALIWSGADGAIAGGATIRAPRLVGQLGSSPIAIQAARLRLGIAQRDFTASTLSVRLGRGGAVNRLDATAFTGAIGGRGVAGRFQGLSGKLAAVPLLLDEGAGRWSLAGNDLNMDGRVRVSDSVEPPRFHPLVAPDFHLSLKDGGIVATGRLDDPETGTRILQTRIVHDLGSGRGRASLDVPGITFDESYQPEQLTRLTTGVVALVRGVVRGQGEIAWDEKGTSSTGTFGTDDLDFAAAFGPVEGFRTQVHFTDLLGLVSAPAELAEADLIQAGIDVLDGRIRYQLLPDLRVKVEGGTWPYAGGELALQETILDFAKPTTKALTFRVTGLDAARFIAQMEFSNLSATGTFDGSIPMLFDERGGRIAGGHLVARQEGGTLSYVGELTDKDLGTYGKLAFDALKSMRYSKLTIDLDGALDGEFIAGIELDGIARDPALTAAPSGGISGLVVGRALNQLAKIPFEFNIAVRGPFRALLATARSFEDPSNLIQSVLPEKLREQPALPPADPAPASPASPPPGQATIVQPKESETVR
ncbi:YdbH domain-containing protein [Sphingosinicella sp. BN140058]|uniref:YdbH domain-containing protein n=1 Tax=Sphingosinicella sp. BN140058 TaxID=1892855 RepID=UPI001011F4BA|nr:YdbH domain-containing protein [Sphingosinicella sp. BN140058]QAY75481.1 hypothetical protein ETR14_02265 [Sphingosinicella sp. BN140058]